MVPPLVSVIVATRNRPDQLRRCLHGIAEQTYQSIEVIVADDGSSASTIRAYSDLCPALEGRVKWLLRDRPDMPGSSPAAARNRGIQAATGPFVAFCDDDDRWIRDDHLASGVHALEYADADFFFSNVVSTLDGAPSDLAWFPEQLTRRGRLLPDAPGVFALDIDEALRVVGARAIHPDCWIIRRPLLDKVGGFWERLRFVEDYDLMMRLLDGSRMVLFRPEVCVHYRLAEGDSHSLETQGASRAVHDIAAAQHVRFVCQSAAVRRQARRREAWALRTEAGALRSTDRARESRWLAWQGFRVFPTLGGLKQVLLG